MSTFLDPSIVIIMSLYLLHAVIVLECSTPTCIRSLAAVATYVRTHRPH